ACGLALQAYLRDSATDLSDMIDWSRKHGRRITVRLVKGAYWDYETLIAEQRHWPLPVFARKHETDANFEKLSLTLLENQDVVDAAFGTHNVRSIAYVLAQADHMGIDRRNYEFQMLYGMADPVKAAVLELGCRLREYCPVGELLPGMAYLVRRLLENTSNEAFLASKFARGATREELLKDPGALLSDHAPRITEHAKEIANHQSLVATHPFRNEAPIDLNLAPEREKLIQAVHQERRKLGRRHPLIINGKT